MGWFGFFFKSKARVERKESVPDDRETSQEIMFFEPQILGCLVSVFALISWQKNISCSDV